MQEISADPIYGCSHRSESIGQSRLRDVIRGDSQSETIPRISTDGDHLGELLTRTLDLNELNGAFLQVHRDTDDPLRCVIMTDGMNYRRTLTISTVQRPQYDLP